MAALPRSARPEASANRLRDHLAAGKSLALPRHQKLTDLPLFRSLCERCIDANYNLDFPTAALWLGAALDEFRRNAALQTRDILPHAAMIHALCARIREKPGEPYRVAGLARECHYSLQHFTRIFRRIAGQEPRDFIIQARIEAAAGLLRMSDYPLSRIADLLGYHDPFHFSRQFKARTGLCPSEFRANL